MKCTDIEKRIYFYDELTAREREETDQHLKSCESCRHTMQHVIGLKKVVASHRSHNPVMPNPSFMTHRVMRAIEENKSTSTALWDQVISFLNLSPLRYTMAALSIILVSLFVVESNDSGEILRVQQPYRIAPGPKTVLNIASFHSAFLKKKEAPAQSTTSFANCLAACLRNAEADCEQCTNKYIKP